MGHQMPSNPTQKKNHSSNILKLYFVVLFAIGTSQRNVFSISILIWWMVSCNKNIFKNNG